MKLCWRVWYICSNLEKCISVQTENIWITKLQIWWKVMKLKGAQVWDFVIASILAILYDKASINRRLWDWIKNSKMFRFGRQLITQSVHFYNFGNFLRRIVCALRNAHGPLLSSMLITLILNGRLGGGGLISPQDRYRRWSSSPDPDRSPSHRAPPSRAASPSLKRKRKNTMTRQHLYYENN